MRRLVTLALAVFLLVISAPLAMADPNAPTGVQVLDSGRRATSQQSDGSVAAQGGNVTQVNIDALSVTKSWQGYHGNITGNIWLDDANNKSFYAWGNATPSGEVFATRNDTIQWSTINCTNSSERTDEETYLGHSSTDGDSVTNTFNGTAHPEFFVGSTNITTDSCYSTNVFVNGASQSGEFYQILLSDGYSNIVYSTIIEADSTGYNGDNVDFQLMVGEDEHTGSEGPTTYYFWTELS